MGEIFVKYVQPLTEDEMKQIEALKDRPIVFNEESLQTTPAMIKAFEVAANMRNRLTSKSSEYSCNAEPPVRRDESQSTGP